MEYENQSVYGRAQCIQKACLPPSVYANSFPSQMALISTQTSAARTPIRGGSNLMKLCLLFSWIGNRRKVEEREERERAFF
jgi:hypothetical protein